MAKSIAVIVFLILFAIMSVVNLYFCYVEDERKRKITKPFLLLFLSIALTIYLPDKPLIYTSGFMCLIGDILLLKKKKRVFYAAGGCFFALSHILNFVNISSFFSYSFPWWSLVLAILMTVFLGLFFCFVIQKKFDLFYLMKYSYFSLHLLNFIISLLLIIDGKYLEGSLLLSGYIILCLSDTILDVTLKKTHTKRPDFYIMSTYLTSECLIFLAILLLVGVPLI